MLYLEWPIVTSPQQLYIVFMAISSGPIHGLNGYGRKAYFRLNLLAKTFSGGWGMVGFLYRALTTLSISNRNVVLTIITGFLISFATSFLKWYLPIRINELGGIIFVGLIYSVARALSALLSPLGGVFADTYGRKPMAVLGPLMYLAAFFALLGGINTVWLTVLLLISVPNLVSNSVTLITLENIDGRSRGAVVGFIRVFGSLALIIGNILLPILYVSMGLLPVVVFAVSLCGLAALLRAAYVETFKGKASVVKQTGSLTRRFYDNVKDLLPKGFRTALRGSVLCLTLFGIFSTLGSEVISRYMPIYFNEVLKLNLISIGSLYSFMSFVGILSYLVGGVMSRKIRYAYLVMLPVLSVGLCLLALVAFKNMYSVIALFTILSIGEGIAQTAIPPLFINVLERYPDRKATVMQIQDSLSLATTFFAPFLGALIWLVTPDLVFITSSALLMVSALTLAPTLKFTQGAHNAHK